MTAWWSAGTAWLVGGAAIAAVIALVRWWRQRLSGASVRRLRPHTLGWTGQSADGDDPGVTERLAGAVAPVASWVERSVDGPVRRSGLGAVLRPALVRSNLRLEVAELAGAGVVVAGAVGLGATLAGWSPLVAVALGAGVGVVPTATVVVVGVRRRKQFVAELPDALQLLAGTLRAGYPVSQALSGVAGDVGGPVAAELRRVAAETGLGAELPDALRASARRMGSEDLAWVAVAVDIHQQAGGNLAEVLDTVADTVTQRARLRREVSTLTAEGRMSALVLGLLPPVLAVVITTVNPGYLATLTDEPVGVVLVVSAAVAMVVGFVWMYRIVSVEA